MRDGDFYRQSNGQLLLINGADKADQDIAETLLQPFNSAENLGNEINDIVATVQLGPFYNMMEGIIEQKVREAIGRLMAAQEADSALDYDEVITGISRFAVQESKKHPGTFYYFVEVSLTNGASSGKNKGFKVSIKQAESPAYASL